MAERAPSPEAEFDRPRLVRPGSLDRAALAYLARHRAPALLTGGRSGFLCYWPGTSAVRRRRSLGGRVKVRLRAGVYISVPRDDVRFVIVMPGHDGPCPDCCTATGCLVCGHCTKHRRKSP